MFKYLIAIYPLGMMYGSAGGFLSPENLVGRSRSKFPPDAATLSGLFFSTNKYLKAKNSSQHIDPKQLREELYVAGPFWNNCPIDNDNIFNFYVPIPRHKIISEAASDQWYVEGDRWERKNKDLEPDYQWQTINSWDFPTEAIRTNTRNAATSPWEFLPMLHPDIEDNQRNVKEENGLFLEYAVQMPEETCLIYLSTKPMFDDGWYRFGGENHFVEIKSRKIPEKKPISDLFKEKIKHGFALITPGVWGSSNRRSFRYPQNPDFPPPRGKNSDRELILTDKPIPYRYRAGGKVGRGRYAVPAGSVYVLDRPLNKTWWEWEEGEDRSSGAKDRTGWFPREGFSLKKVGCGLCLPVKIEGVD